MNIIIVAATLLFSLSITSTYAQQTLDSSSGWTAVQNSSVRFKRVSVENQSIRVYVAPRLDGKVTLYVRQKCDDMKRVAPVTWTAGGPSSDALTCVIGNVVVTTYEIERLARPFPPDVEKILQQQKISSVPQKRRIF